MKKLKEIICYVVLMTLTILLGSWAISYVSRIAIDDMKSDIQCCKICK